MALPNKSNDAFINSDNRFDMLLDSSGNYAIFLLNPDAFQSLNKPYSVVDIAKIIRSKLLSPLRAHLALSQSHAYKVESL